MKYLVNFRTTLRVSRYLFRSLALLIWLLGAGITAFYLFTVLKDKETAIRDQLFSNFEQIQWHSTHLAETLRELKYVSENQLNSDHPRFLFPENDKDSLQPQLHSLYQSLSCNSTSTSWQSKARILQDYLQFWQSRYVSSYEISRIFLIDPESNCLGTFVFDDNTTQRVVNLRSIREHAYRYQNGQGEDKRNPMYWIESDEQQDAGHYYMSIPIYQGNDQVSLITLEQKLRLDETVNLSTLPVNVALLDRVNHMVLGQPAVSMETYRELPTSKQWFGYIDNYRALALKKVLSPSPYSLVYSVSTSVIFNQMKLMLFNALLLNIFTALALISIALLFERRMFLPAVANAQNLEEHEQFNRKIVASAPVGICILRTSDGNNILSNELAHNYLSLLTVEDRKRLGDIIRGQQVNFVDMVTGSKTNLQMSFVHSRYRNEDVAICVLVDVSARVKLEQSLQEIAEVAEQANRSKSMFLATVSHELRTPLYGIIGNLDLLQTRELPESVRTLVSGMNNASSLLLKIINDILDFSKIESEQLKITPEPFSPYEVLSHVVSNYQPLVVKKRLSLWCLVEADVPVKMDGDPIRLQQVISNFLSNAIKFTHTGGIVIHLWQQDQYLHIQIRDTGTGIAQRDVLQLFDPFFQVGNGVQRNFQGTGLGLAICEKLVNMMDGDIAVESEPDMGSQFTIRLPIWQGQYAEPNAQFVGKTAVLKFSNQYLQDYVTRLLTAQQIQVIPAEAILADSVIITDDQTPVAESEYLLIQLDHQHNDKPCQYQTNCWKMTPAMVHLLPELLQQICFEKASVSKEDKELQTNEVVANFEQDICVLVVDDHPINRLLLSEQLNSLGVATKVASDGLEALKVLAHNVIDIVLTDVNMPNLDGYGLTEKLREQGATLPIIGVTANALAEEKVRCLAIGMDYCLSKPVTLEELRETLEQFSP